VWGEARATLDVDLAVWVEPAEVDATVDELCRRFQALPKNPVEFVRATHVLPLTTSHSVRADIVFGILPVEKDIVQRATAMQVAGAEVLVASVEDLILMKSTSERERDLEDARLLLRRFGNKIDRGYLEPRLTDLAESLARPEIRRMLDEAPGRQRRNAYLVLKPSITMRGRSLRASAFSNSVRMVRDSPGIRAM
jgi:hypothetical protein